VRATRSVRTFSDSGSSWRRTERRRFPPPTPLRGRHGHTRRPPQAASRGGWLRPPRRGRRAPGASRRVLFPGCSRSPAPGACFALPCSSRDVDTDASAPCPCRAGRGAVAASLDGPLLLTTPGTCLRPPGASASPRPGAPRWRPSRRSRHRPRRAGRRRAARRAVVRAPKCPLTPGASRPRLTRAALASRPPACCTQGGRGA
jgi:hypothetical protein